MFYGLIPQYVYPQMKFLDACVHPVLKFILKQMTRKGQPLWTILQSCFTHYLKRNIY